MILVQIAFRYLYWASLWVAGVTDKDKDYFSFFYNELPLALKKIVLSHYPTIHLLFVSVQGIYH